MNKKTKVAIIGIIALVLVTIGITYAYWLITRTQQGENIITTGCLDITLNGSGDITLADQFPLSDEDGMKLTPYTFTVTNNCNTSVDYQVALEALEAGDEISSDALKVALDDTAKLYSAYSEVDATENNAYEARKMLIDTLEPKNTEGSSKTHELRIWIEAEAPISEINKTFKSKITVTVGQGISNINEGAELASLILEDAETNNYLYTTTPDFSTVTADGEYGLYSAEDDYGTSYYFRGDVENNYVKLGTWKEEIYEYLPDGVTDYGTYGTYEECMAQIELGAPWAECEKFVIGSEGDSMYWRIVRINGDGTIRLVYDGTSVVETRTVTIGNPAYNTNYNNAKYVGYTYDVDGVQTDSTIKGVVEDWYANNLEADYGKYIADSIFCNDRQVTSTSTNGNTQYYGAYDRVEINKSPKLSCTQDADKYTVSSAKGNGLLTKPIGLLTADEVAMAGGISVESNYDFYLKPYYIFFWTMSPSSVGGNDAYVWGVYGTGGLHHVNVKGSVDGTIGARPVINLKADVLFEGNGTIDSPYEIVMN